MDTSGVKHKQRKNPKQHEPSGFKKKWFGRGEFDKGRIKNEGINRREDNKKCTDSEN